MARNIRLTGFAFALVAAALFGSLVSQTIGTAEAQTPPRQNAGTVYLIPPGWTPPPPPWATPADDAVAGDKDTIDLGETDAFTCSLVDGCEIPVAITTSEGEVLKLMVITFEDMPEGDDPVVTIGE